MFEFEKYPYALFHWTYRELVTVFFRYLHESSDGVFIDGKWVVNPMTVIILSYPYCGDIVYDSKCRGSEDGLAVTL
jgi:hypothetical protein